MRFSFAVWLCLATASSAQTTVQLKPIQKPTPEYPSESMALDAIATVIVKTTISPSGEVSQAQAVRWRMRVDRWINDPAVWSAHPERPFIAAAEDAARHWTFSPVDAETSVELSFGFRLSDGSTRVGNLSGPWNAIEDHSTPPAKPGRRVVRVGGSISSPRKIVDVSAIYPDGARVSAANGPVILELHIGDDGSVVDAHVLRSMPALDAVALAAARQWKFEATTAENEPVEVLLIAPVVFSAR